MTTLDFETLSLEKTGDFASLTINRPEKLNALNLQVLGELEACLTSLREEALGLAIKGLILTGAGERAFIAGADIKEMADMDSEKARTFGELGQKVTLMLESLPIPVIACVNGHALGGGCEMAMGCDFIYATESAVFGQPEVKLGLIPGFGGTQRLARLVGRQRAREIIYSGRMVLAPEALQIGLVLKLFPTQKELMQAAFQGLEAISKASPLAVATAKKVINQGCDLTVEQGLSEEASQFSAIFNSRDMREGTRAFVEKRPPQFCGK